MTNNSNNKTGGKIVRNANICECVFCLRRLIESHPLETPNINPTKLEFFFSKIENDIFEITFHKFHAIASSVK